MMYIIHMDNTIAYMHKTWLMHNGFKMIDQRTLPMVITCLLFSQGDKMVMHWSKKG